MKDFLLATDLDSFDCAGLPRPDSFGDLAIMARGYLERLSDGSLASNGPELTEILAQEYRRYGDDFPRRLAGEYCGVVVDRQRSKVLLFQDSFGLRPLFYAVEGRRLIVSSRIERLVALLPHASIDDAYFRHMFTTSLLPHHLTPWKEIDRLMLGYCAEFSGVDTLRLFRPWVPRYDDRNARVPEEPIEQFEDLLARAVSVALAGSENPCCELSGGLDSTTVLATAASQRDVKALTIVTEFGSASRTDPYVEAAIRKYSVDWIVVDNDENPPYSVQETDFNGEPGIEAFYSNIAAFRAALSENGVDVLLTGKGGDVVFGGPDVQPHYLADHVSGAGWPNLMRAVRSHQVAAEERRSETHWLVHYAFRSAWRHSRGQTFTVPGLPANPLEWLNRDFLNADILRRDPEKQWAPKVSRPGAQYLWEEVYSQAASQSTPFRMNSDFETRHPLFYRPLAEYMCALDDSFRRTANADRILQRQAMRGKLPEIVRTRDTKGSAHRLMERSLMDSANWLDMLTDDPRLARRGWIDYPKWRDAIDQARVGCSTQGYHLRLAMAVECWLRNIETKRPSLSFDRLLPAERSSAVVY